MSLSGLSDEAAAKQVQALTLCFSRETLTIVHNLGLTTEERASAASIIDAIKNYVVGHINESVERQNFRHWTQQPGESFDDYLVSLRELVKTCNFCNDACTQKSLRDQIIEGILDGDTVEHLLNKKTLLCRKQFSCAKPKKQPRNNELPYSKGPSHLHESVAALKTHPQKKTFTPHPICPGCGGQPHPVGRTQRPAYCASCHNCKKMGHFSRVCRSKPIQPVGSQPSTSGLQSTQQDSFSEQAGLSNIHYVTSTDPAPKLKSLPLMEPPPQLLSQTQVQIFQQPVEVFCLSSMNMLTTFCLLLSSLKLQMEQRYTPLACYRSVLRLET